TTEALNGAVLINEDDAFVVGAGGTILLSEDHGLTWTAQYSGSSEDLLSACFLPIKTRIRFAVGSNGTILRSSDRGDNWQSVSSGTARNLNAIVFQDTLRGIIAGEGGLLLQTEDAGLSWTLSEAVTAQDLHDCAFAGNNSAIAVGEGGTILRNDALLTALPMPKAPQLPRTLVLGQNYPNPFNPTTVISYQLSVVSDVSLAIYDLQGKKVAGLVDARQRGGSYQVQWNGRDDAGRPVSSGVYFYRIVARFADGRNAAETRKMLLLR
ncbi:MAG: T9SS type A sorting domain-containing protein, partial [Calditrichaeota bacterium]|nr:T9SS type A sorting domain-containing protein [Calditrichota bacterium]